jgi:hypothetical protein
MSFDCNDLLSVAVQAILNRGTNSTAAQILSQMQALCPASGITLEITQTTLDDGVGRGVLNFCVVDGDATFRYCINNDMVRLRKGNLTYYRQVDPNAPPAACST